MIIFMFPLRSTPREAAGFLTGVENMGLCPHRRALQNLVMVVVVEGEAWVNAWWEGTHRKLVTFSLNTAKNTVIIIW